MGSTPTPPSIENVQKKAQKNYLKTFGFGLDPPPPFGKCPKGSSFFFWTTSLIYKGYITLIIHPSLMSKYICFLLFSIFLLYMLFLAK